MSEQRIAAPRTFTVRVTLAAGSTTIADVGEEHLTMLDALAAADTLGKRLASLVARKLLADVLSADYDDLETPSS